MQADICGFGTSPQGFTNPEYQANFPQKLELLWSTSELHGGSTRIRFNKWFTKVQWRILKLENITLDVKNINVYGCTSKKGCGLQRAECMQALQAGVRKLILDIVYFLLLKSFCETFLYFIIWTNKIQRLLALPELFMLYLKAWLLAHWCKQFFWFCFLGLFS